MCGTNMEEYTMILFYYREYAWIILLFISIFALVYKAWILLIYVLVMLVLLIIIKRL